MSRLSQQEREIRHNSKYSKDSWGFIVKEQSEGSLENYKEETSRVREFLLSPLNRTPAEGRTG